ncbi:MAG: 4-alpha-glucanotransferase [Deltaproteobacteria bacterium]|nr:4-alpha-glucanotransferase [Deltaproteobacteria bacterium]
MERFARSSGILLPIFSLPSRFGIGDLGDGAHRFIDFLAEAKQSLWQILPLGPTSGGNLHSPYVALSAFAGNPLFISLEMLVEDGLLAPEEIRQVPEFSDQVVDYGRVSAYKLAVLRRVAERFAVDAPARWQASFSQFCERHRWWLDDYTFFMALRATFQDASWHEWEPALQRREPAALQEWRGKIAQEIRLHELLQCLFFAQWQRLKLYAHRRSVKIIGDIPIYVGFDSAEVWAHPELFDLDGETRLPRLIAGVPPDYFSETGQRWGNPLYRWRDAHDRPVQAVYDWWIQRFRATFELVDLVRVDHFRGFESYWAIPAEEQTAMNGHWVPGPGARLFSAVQHALGDLPIIAEDLGVITPEVDALRRQFGFPGMKILQFAFGGDVRNPYLPHNYGDPRCVVFTGTHDNDTALGWFRSTTDECRSHVLHYLGRAAEADLHWELIRLAWSSVAALAIAPLQDVLGLGREGRTNTPGQAQGNWEWRYTSDALGPELSHRLAELTHLYGRDET